VAGVEISYADGVRNREGGRMTFAQDITRVGYKGERFPLLNPEGGWGVRSWGRLREKGRSEGGGL